MNLTLAAATPASRARSSWRAQQDATIAEEPFVREDPRPVSLLDEAHRRMKANVQAISDRLRLESSRVDQPSTEAVLTDMLQRIQATAAFHKARCRAGNFDHIDLAVYLRRIASLMNTPARIPACGGWILEAPGHSLAWRDEPVEAGRTASGRLLDLEGALGFVVPEWREAARRAVFACAVVAPPSIFTWRSPQSGPGRGHGGEAPGPGEVSISLRAAGDRMAVELRLSDRCLGLPARFEMKQRRSLGLDLVLVLAHQFHNRLKIGPDRRVTFEVTFTSAREAARQTSIAS